MPTQTASLEIPKPKIVKPSPEFEVMQNLGKSVLDKMRNAVGLKTDKSIEQQAIKSQTKTELAKWLPESLKNVDKVTAAAFAVSGAALIASKTNMVTKDKSIKEKLDKFGYGAAALGLVSLAPEKYKKIGYMAVVAGLVYFLGKDILGMAKGMLGLAKDMATSPIETFKKYSEDPSLLLEKLEIKEKQEEKSQAERTEKREEALDDSVKQAEQVELDGKNRTKLIQILTLRSNKQTAEALVGDMSDLTIETVLDGYSLLKSQNKISGKENLNDLLEKIRDHTIALEEETLKKSLPWHQKGLIKQVREFASLGFSILPVVGNAYTAVTAVTGQDYIGGDELSGVERASAAVLTFIPFGALGKVAIKGTSKAAVEGVLAGHLSKLGLAISSRAAVTSSLLSIPRFQKIGKLHKSLKAGKITQAAFDKKVAEIVGKSGFDAGRTAKLAEHVYPKAQMVHTFVNATDIFRDDQSFETIKNLVAIQELERSIEIVKGKTS